MFISFLFDQTDRFLAGSRADTSYETLHRFLQKCSFFLSICPAVLWPAAALKSDT